ncbi:hypothetical protein AB833_19255 [Chromatiales bacterium (ex Bugula neritina AB1)]|nr:hypothetical protein AB833_19255 [Chromatiales bacterium (ex Bugula neritina AB1)]
MKIRLLALSIAALCLNNTTLAEGDHHSAYAGEQHRSIKSLSSADIADLKAGAGWGLAKSAELNGVPGPLHLLEMQDEIELSALQLQQITKVFNEMRSTARTLGEQLTDQESKLDEKFRNDIPAEDELKSILSEIGSTRSALRYVHLSAHLKMPEILSSHQIKTYNRIRGYTDTNPCENVPEGHDETMWKKHNGCE